MRAYAVYVSDLRESHDRLIDRRVNRDAARRVVREKNREVIERVGARLADGTPSPVFYCIRETEV